MAQQKRSDGWILQLWGLTAVGMPVALWMIFLYAPEERVMGASQKIFYFHVPAAIVTFTAVFILLAGSVGYIWTRNRKWDHLSLAATEVAIVFCTLVLVTGPLWAKPAWGVWWTWEAKITTTLILWLLLVACRMVRHYAENSELGARLEPGHRPDGRGSGGRSRVPAVGSGARRGEAVAATRRVARSSGPGRRPTPPTP